MKLPVLAKVSAFVSTEKVPPEATASVPALMVIVPVLPLVPPSVRVPVPFFVRVVGLVTKPPVMVVLPVPPMTTGCAPVRLARVVVVVTGLPVVNGAEVKKLLFELIVPAPVRVAAPKVRPAVPLVTNSPAPAVNVNAPRLSVPSVCVAAPTPAVVRSLKMAVLPPTVVARAKLMPVLSANCKVPPFNCNAPAPKAPAFVVARKIPEVRVVVPVSVFAPDSVTMPTPALATVTVPAVAPVILPASTILPAELVPLTNVRLDAPFVMVLPEVPTVSVLAELLVKDCVAPRVRLRLWVLPPTIPPTLVAAAPGLTTMPLPLTVRVWLAALAPRL